MNPINYDLIVCIVSLIAGVFMFIKIGAFNRRNYTPLIFAMVICSGILYWSALLLVTYAAIYHVPTWLDIHNEWFGTWGYTSGRILNGMCWLLTLAAINYYLPLIRRCKQKQSTP